jgi:hypothetical protein
MIVFLYGTYEIFLAVGLIFLLLTVALIGASKFADFMSRKHK